MTYLEIFSRSDIRASHLLLNLVEEMVQKLVTLLSPVYFNFPPKANIGHSSTLRHSQQSHFSFIEKVTPSKKPISGEAAESLILL